MARSFGPAVVFTTLMAAGVRFHYIGFITHYAGELYRRQSPVDVGDHPRSNAENTDRLARALRELGAAAYTDDGAEPFTGDGSALGGHQRFRTRHGDLHITVRTPAADEATSGMDAFSTGVRIAITVPTPTLRAYAATGEFPGLDNVLRMAELFDGPDPRPS